VANSDIHKFVITWPSHERLTGNRLANSLHQAKTNPCQTLGMSPFLITDQEGFTPHLSRLVSMMNYARRTTLEMVRGLTVEELDFLPSADGNSIGILLEHFAAVEVAYQVSTFEERELNKAEIERWEAGLELGRLGREKLRGRDISYYLQTLQAVRDKTFEEFRRRNDDWLHQEFPFWGQTGNNYFCWFHVFEDEINHRGQMRLIYKQLPRVKNRGVLGIRLAPAREDGVGLKFTEVFPNGAAAKAGLQSGDVIVELNGKDIRGLPLEDIDSRGQAGESVRLKVQREGVAEPLDFEVVREPVKDN
jgi:uncharacterized damage-inducible protein DinB